MSKSGSKRSSQILECARCGAPLQVRLGKTITRCAYCGTESIAGAAVPRYGDLDRRCVAQMMKPPAISAAARLTLALAAAVLLACSPKPRSDTRPPPERRPPPRRGEATRPVPVRVAPIAKKLCRPGCDLQTDAGRKAAFDALVERNFELDKHSLRCVRRPKAFPGVVVQGSFAFDRGCGAWKVFVGCCLLDLPAAAPHVLARAGWATAGQAKRASLASAWALDVFAGFRSVTHRSTPHFGTGAEAFHPPRATSTAAGGVTVTFWVRNPSGMRPGTGYTHWALAFDAAGRYVRRRLGRFFRRR